jgi:hypothetical protein
MVIKRVEKRGDDACPKSTSTAQKKKKKSKTPRKENDNPLFKYEEKFRKCAAAFASKVSKRAKYVHLPMDQQNIIKVLMGEGARAPSALTACDVAARKKFAELLYDEILYESKRTDRKRRFYFITFLWEKALTGDEKPVVRQAEFQKIVRSHLTREFGHFSGVFEIQASNNETHVDGGKQLCLHPHIIAWTDRDIAVEAVEERLNRAFGDRVGICAAVKVDPIIDPEKSFYRILHYMLKPPGFAKTLYLNPTTGKKNLHESEKSDRYVRFARLFDILSNMPFSQVIFSGGEGQFATRRALSYLKEWHKQRRRTLNLVNLSQIADLWLKLRPKLLDHRFEPPRYE